jgi:UDP-glucose 4-epimerase
VDWIFVEDVVEGLLLSALTPGIEGMAFDLGSGSLVSVRQLVEQIIEVMQTDVRPKFGAVPDRPLEQERAADTTFLKERLMWAARTPLRLGLEATVTWYRARNLAPVVHH